LQKHLRRVTRLYRARKDTLWECLHSAFQDRISVRAPEGGLALWVEFGNDTAVDAMVKRAADHGLIVRSGRQFSPFDDRENALRLGFASMNHDEIAEAVKRLLYASKQ